MTDRQRPAALPISLRNKLFTLFDSALKYPKRAVEFKRLSLSPGILLGEGAAEASEVAYIKDRAQRFQRVLAALAAGRKFKEPLLRDLWVGELLFNEGLFFDCHEYLEIPWKGYQGEVKVMLQGLIQAAAGLHKLELGSVSGCLELLEKAQAKLSGKAINSSITLDGFVQDLKRASNALRSGNFVLTDAPRMNILNR